jgi:hypothetical protein
MFTSSGRHIQISGRRYCEVCKSITDQVCHKVRYQDNEQGQQGTLLKKSFWICSTCVTESEEVKIQLLPGDKVKIINRLLGMQEDYAITSMKIASGPQKLVIEMMVEETA